MDPRKRKKKTNQSTSIVKINKTGDIKTYPYRRSEAAKKEVQSSHTKPFQRKTLEQMAEEGHRRKPQKSSFPIYTEPIKSKQAEYEVAKAEKKAPYAKTREDLERERIANSVNSKLEEMFQKHPTIAMSINKTVQASRAEPERVLKQQEYPSIQELSPLQALTISRAMQWQLNRASTTNAEEKRVLQRNLKMMFKEGSLLQDMKTLKRSEKDWVLKIVDFKLDMPEKAKKALLEQLRKELGI